MTVSILHLKGQYGARYSALSESRLLLPLLRHVVLPMPVVKGRRARDALSETSKILLFKCGKINYNTMKDVNN